MPYGQGRRLGETIDPRLMQADFSGVERAGQYIGQGIARVGEGLAIRENQKKDITAADETAESIKRLLPDYADLAQAAQEKLRNKDISHRDKRGIAESLDNMLKIGIAQRKFDMDALGMALERDRLEASMRGEPITVLTPDEVRAAREQGISLSDGFIDDQGNFHVRKVGVPLPKPAGWTYGTDAAGNPIPMRSEGQQFAPVGNIRQGAQSFGGVPTSPGFGAGIDTSPPNLAAVMDGGVLPPRNDMGGPGPVPTIDAPHVQLDQYGYPQQPQAAPVNNNPPMLRPNATQAAKDLTALPPGISKPQLEMAKQVQGLRQGEAALSRDEQEAELARQKAAAEQQKLAQAGKKEQAQEGDMMRKALMDVQDINVTRQELKKQFQGQGVIGGVARKAGQIPGGTSDRLKTLMSGIAARMSVQEITKMRQNSPTGAAVGNPSDKDVAMLKEQAGTLDPTADPAMLDRTLVRIQTQYADLIHGSREQREKLLKDGKITPMQNAIAETYYPQEELDTKGNLVPRQRYEPEAETLFDNETRSLIDNILRK